MLVGDDIDVAALGASNDAAAAAVLSSCLTLNFTLLWRLSRSAFRHARTSFHQFIT